MVYAIVFLGAALVALLVTPVVTRIARRMRIMDRPGTRKVHSGAVPRIGGIAVVAAVLAVTIPLLFLDNQVGEAFRRVRTQVVALLAASGFICIIGLIDDIRGVRARVKLLAQIAAALGVCCFGIRLGPVGIGTWWIRDLGYWSWPLTVFWIVGITNAVNLIDGLDGLAAGISAIACAVIAAFAFHCGQGVMGALMLALLGSLLGFLFFNFNPARVFLGDCGSMFLGFFLSAASVMSATKSYTLVGLALPALALGLPIFDTFFSILRRVLERRSLFAPDRNHIHHRLIDMGFNQRHAVILMYVVTLVAAGIGMFMMVTRDLGVIIVFACALLPLVLVFRVFGAIRLREAFSALRRNRAIAREAKENQQGFEEMQLRLRQAKGLEQWWKAIRRAAREFNFARLTIEFENQNAKPRKLVWRLPHRELSTDEMIYVTFPLRQHVEGEALRVDVDVPVNGSLEAAGGRIALFGRLLDEYSLVGPPARHSVEVHA